MQINELHSVLLEILIEIDKCCRKNDIPYSLGGGTMLGAVRDHAFIPWDDDADISIMYKDLERFKNALKADLPDYMEVVEPDDVLPNFYDFVVRIIDKRYTWHESKPEDAYYQDLIKYVNIDVFCVNSSSNTLIGHKIKTFEYKMIYSLAMGHRFSIDYSKYSPIFKVITLIVSNIGKLFSMKFLLYLYKKLNEATQNEDTKYCVTVNDLPNYIGLERELSWYKDVVDVEFENNTFQIIAGYHEKMTQQYGDYMTPRQGTEFIKHLEDEES